MIDLINYKIDDINNHQKTYKNRIKIERREKNQKNLSIFRDDMFKTMFQNESRIKYSAKLLSYFIEVPYEELLKNMRFAKNEQDKEKVDSKGLRSDYVVEYKDVKINIEVNNNYKEYTIERNIDYIDRIYTSENKKDKKYNYIQSIQININNYAYEGIEEAVDVYTIRNKENISLTNKIIIIQIYIPKLKEKSYNELEEREKYILALVSEDKEELERISKDIEMAKEYVEESENVALYNGYGESYDHEAATLEAIHDVGVEDGATTLTNSLFKANDI